MVKRMKFSLLTCVISLFSAAALAQTNNDPDNMNQRSPQREGPTGSIPRGGCTPIGLTARGDFVFPMQCRELIERERGPILDHEVQAPNLKNKSAPAVEAPMAKQSEVTPTESPRARPHKGRSSGVERKKSIRTHETEPESTGSIGKNSLDAIGRQMPTAQYYKISGQSSEELSRLDVWTPPSPRVIEKRGTFLSRETRQYVGARPRATTGNVMAPAKSICLSRMMSGPSSVPVT